MPVAAKEVRFAEEQELHMRIIESSNVRWLAWPADGRPLMVVCYQNGSLYGYLGVSRQRAVACAYAESTGSYINKKIKPHFEVVKLELAFVPA